MGTFSPAHWLVVLLLVIPLLALLIVPACRIFRRAGFSGAWGLTMVIPLLGILALWVLAFLKWPSDKEGRTRTNKPAIVAGVLMLPLAIGAIFAFSAASVREVATVEQRARPVPQQPAPSNDDEWWKKGSTPARQSDGNVDGPWKKYQRQ